MTSYFKDDGHDVIRRMWRHWLALRATVPDPQYIRRTCVS